MSKQQRSEDTRPLTLDEANAEIDRLRAQLAVAEKSGAEREPIAVVGMGCRSPPG